MTNYKITTKVMDLITDLIEEGYKGDATITNSYPTGARDTLGNSYSIQLSGFSKECLYVTGENDIVLLVGRYRVECDSQEPTVKDIVDIAWEMFTYYEARGYTMPDEFEELFIKYGKIVKKTVTKEVYERV